VEEVYCRLDKQEKQKKEFPALNFYLISTKKNKEKASFKVESGFLQQYN
jgi:hypothetical protein